MIYFDNSATTQIWPEVLDTYNQVCQKIWGNPSSLHKVGETAWNLQEQARKQIADLFDVLPSEIVFTSGGSEGDNWVIKGTAIEKRQYGKHIITTSVEHAILCAKQFIGDEPFAVLLGDDVVDGEVPALKQLMDVYDKTGCKFYM